MENRVSVHFGQQCAYELPLSAADTASLSREAARAWLEEQCDRLGCPPVPPMGRLLLSERILLSNMVLKVAGRGGEARFRSDPAWTRNFAAATLIALGRPEVRVDLSRNTVA